MAIVITNTAAVKNSAETLSSNAVKIKSVQTSIEFLVNEVKEYWEQSQEDAQSFANGLQSNSDYLEKMVECNKEFASSITNYMEVTEKTANQTAG